MVSSRVKLRKPAELTKHDPERRGKQIAGARRLSKLVGRFSTKIPELNLLSVRIEAIVQEEVTSFLMLLIQPDGMVVLPSTWVSDSPSARVL